MINKGLFGSDDHRCSRARTCWGLWIPRWSREDRSTWVTDEAWITQYKEGRREITTANWEKNKTDCLKWKEISHIMSLAPCHLKNPHTVLSSPLRFYWNLSFSTGILTIALLLPVVNWVYKVNPTTAKLISRRASGISHWSCSTAWAQQLWDQQRTRCTTQIHDRKLLKHGNCLFLSFCARRSNFLLQSDFKISH